jgi:predicted permease
MAQILVIVLPVFLIIAAGYWLKKNKLVEDSWVHVLNAFVYYVSLPAIILISFWQIDWSEQGMFLLFVANLGILIAFTFFLLFIFSFLRMPAKAKVALLMVALVGNTIYMGFPILGPALSGEYFSSIIGTATIHLVIGIIISILAAEYLVNRSGRIDKYLLDFIKNPLMIALGLGIVLSFITINSQVLEVIKKPVSMLAATASPLALFALGSFMHGRLSRTHLKLSIFGSFLKLLIFPLFAWFFIKILGLSNSGAEISALVSAMPVAATTFVIAEKHKLDQAFVGTAILVSTAASLVTIVVLLAWFS